MAYSCIHHWRTKRAKNMLPVEIDSSVSGSDSKDERVCWEEVFFIFPPPKGKIEVDEDCDDEKRNGESVCEKKI